MECYNRQETRNMEEASTGNRSDWRYCKIRTRFRITPLRPKQNKTIDRPQKRKRDNMQKELRKMEEIVNQEWM